MFDEIDIEASLGIIFAVGILNSALKFVAGYKPLKINETVLG